MRALAALVRERPRALRLVLAGRADPPLPIARLRLSGELREIRARDLAFSPDEAAALLAGADLVVAPGQVRTLVDQTAGWAAGLRLAALSLREAGDVDRFLADLAGNSKAISDYLVGEVLSALPSGTTDVLRAVSVCDELSAGLAVALTGRPDAGEVLASLERETVARPQLRRGPHPRTASTRCCARICALDLQAPASRAGRPPARRGRRLVRRHGGPARGPAARPPGRRRRPGGGAARRARTGARRGRGARRGARRAGLPRPTRRRRGDPFVALLDALVATEDGASAAVDRHLARAAATWPDDPAAELVALRDLVRSRMAGRSGDQGGWCAPRPSSTRRGPRGHDLVGTGRLDLALTPSCPGRGGAAARRGARRRPARSHGYLAARALACWPWSPRRRSYRRMAELADGRRRRAHARGLAGDRGRRARAAAGRVRCAARPAPRAVPRPARPPRRRDPATAAFDSAALGAARGGTGRPAPRRGGRCRSCGSPARPWPAGHRPGWSRPPRCWRTGSPPSWAAADIAADLARRAGELFGATGELVLMAARRDVSGGLEPRAGTVLDGAVACGRAVDGRSRPMSARATWHSPPDRRPSGPASWSAALAAAGASRGAAPPARRRPRRDRPARPADRQLRRR